MPEMAEREWGSVYGEDGVEGSFILFWKFRDVAYFEKKKYNILVELCLYLGGSSGNIYQLMRWKLNGELQVVRLMLIVRKVVFRVQKKGNIWLVPEVAKKSEDQRKKDN